MRALNALNALRALRALRALSTPIIVPEASSGQ